MRIFTILTIIFLTYFTSFAQNNNDKTKPKIGLVLSGGGAKGFAYVGVLKAMEEAGIRPDYIVGTSIGSIVGGLYAIGYSADQLDTLIRNINWDLVLSNNVPLTYISYEEKEYYNRYLITLPFIDKKPSLPSGVIEGQMLSDLLNKLTWPAMKYKSFNEFPIPFRCVATDVSTGKTIVFDKGSLAEALRASMSIPSAFTAVDLDSTLAVDGGILNNFPVDEVINMGADYIIGLDVSDGFENAKDIGSITGILAQISMFESLKRTEKDIEKCDFYLNLDLQDYGVSDFSSSGEILEIGNNIGEETKQKFKEIAKQLNIDSKEHEIINITTDSIKVDNIIIEGNSRVPDKLILSKLNINEGEIVSQKDVEEAILRVYGINSFKKVLYEIEYVENTDNMYNLQIHISEKPPVNMKTSVHYDNLFSAGVILNFTMRNILGKGSRTLVIGDISENPRFRFDYLKYFGAKERLALNVRYNFMNLDIPQYAEGKKDDELGVTSHNFSLAVTTTHSLKHSFVGGVNYSLDRKKSYFSPTIPEGFKHFSDNNMSLIGGYIQNYTNDRNYPTKGRETFVYVKYFFNNKYKFDFDDSYSDEQPTIDSIVNTDLTPKQYAQVYFFHKVYYHISNEFQVIPSINLGGTISTLDTNNLYSRFDIGGNQMIDLFDTRMMGLHYAELSENNFLKLGLHLQNVLWGNLYLQYGVDVLTYYPYIPVDHLSLFDFDRMINDYSMIGYGLQFRYKSIIGPISFGVSGNSRDKYLRYYFQLGFSMNYND